MKLLPILFTLLIIASISLAYTVQTLNITSSSETDYQTWQLNLSDASLTDANALFEFNGTNYTATKTNLGGGNYEFNVTKRAPWYHQNQTWPLSLTATNYSKNFGGHDTDYVGSSFYLDRSTTLTAIGFVQNSTDNGGVGNDNYEVYIYNASGSLLYYDIHSYASPIGTQHNMQSFAPSLSMTPGYYVVVFRAYADNNGNDWLIAKYPVQSRNMAWFQYYGPNAGNKLFNSSLMDIGYTSIANISFSDGLSIGEGPNYTYKWFYNVTNATATYTGNTSYTTFTVSQKYSNLINMSGSSTVYFNYSTTITPTTPAQSFITQANPITQAIEQWYNTSGTWGYGDDLNLSNNPNLTLNIQSSLNTRKFSRNIFVPAASLKLNDTFTALENLTEYNYNNITNQTFYRFAFCSGPVDNGVYCGQCTDLTCLKQVLYYTYADLLNFTSLNASQVATFFNVTADSQASQTDSFSRSLNSSHAYYIYPSTVGSIVLSSTEGYTVPSYTSNIFYLTNDVITTQQNITRYFTATATSGLSFVTIKVTYGSASPQPVPNVVVLAQYYNLANNSLVNAGMTTTNAQGIGSLLLPVTGTFYAFSVFDSGGATLYNESSASLIGCPPATGCEKDIVLASAPGTNVTNATITANTFAITWNDLNYSITNASGEAIGRAFNNSQTAVFNISSINGTLNLWGMNITRYNGTDTNTSFYGNSGTTSTGGVLTANLPFSNNSNYSDTYIITVFWNSTQFGYYYPPSPVIVHIGFITGLGEAQRILYVTQPISGPVWFLILLLMAALVGGYIAQYTIDGAGAGALLTLLVGSFIYDPVILQPLNTAGGLIAISVDCFVATLFLGVAWASVMYIRYYGG